MLRDREALRVATRSIANIVLLLLTITVPLQASAADSSKAKAWALGERLSQAAIEYARGGDPGSVDSVRMDAEAIARQLGVEVRPFPPRSADAAAQMVVYLVKGDGWALARQINDKFGYAHAVLYEIAVKANLLLLHRDPQGDVTKALTSVIAERSREIRLPAYIWQGVVDLGRGLPAQEPLARTLHKMHDGAIAFLSKDAIPASSGGQGSIESPGLEVRIELPKRRYVFGESFSFVVTTNRDCNFLVFTVDGNDKVEIHDPVASGDYMGHPLLKAGERRQIPVPDAPGRAVIKPPAGFYEIGAVCSRDELAKLGLVQAKLIEPAKSGRRSFQFHLEEQARGADRNALSRTTASYEVAP